MADVLGSLAPGRSVELTWRRGGAVERAKVELAEHPAGQRPLVVGASWTRDYALAVAWEDGAASLDAATGAVLWSFRGIRPRFHVKAFGSTDGRLYLYEAFRPDRERDPSWVATPGASSPLPQALDLGHRVICLSDFTGDPAWIHPFDIPSGDPSVNVEAWFLGKYLSEQVTLYHAFNRSGTRDWSLWIFGADPSVKPERRPLVGGPILASAVDEEAGTITYVTEITNERRERHLYSRSFEGGKKEPKPLEFALSQGKFMPSQAQNHPVVALAADRNLLAMVVAPSQAGAEFRIWVFKDGQPHREIKLPEGRTLPLGRPAGAFLQDGLLFVYNVPREKSGPGGRAFLTAFRTDGDAADPVAWEAVAPGVTTTAAATWSMLPGTGSLLVFSAPRATVPGQPGENPMTVVYDKSAEGYLRQEHLQLVPFPDGTGGSSPAAVWRGRLYVSAPQGMQLFGP
jgi:hypothetical protein